MKKYTQRTRFGDVVVEFMPPAGPPRRRRRLAHGRERVVILCPGVPAAPPRAALVEFFSKKGFWCFAMRYRGTWESGGTFLKYSPERDVRMVMDGLSRGFADAFTGKRYRIRAPEVYLFGTSFGGPAVILSSRDPRVRKVVAVSPVVDWKARSSESVVQMKDLAKRAFGDAFRFSGKDWMRLVSGKFYNPAAALARVDGKKILIIHAKDDRVAPFAPAKKFAAASGATLLTLRRGGHLSSSAITKPALFKKIRGFLAT